MRNCLSIIPNVCTRAVAAPPAVAASFIAPQPSIELTHHRRRLQDGEVSGNRLNYFCWQCAGIKRVAEQSRLLMKIIIGLSPIFGDLVNAFEFAAIPWFILS